MTQTARQNCKFFLLRYVPNAVRDEFVNIGLVLLPPQAPPEVRFSKDWSRVQSLDPQADTELLQAFRDELSGKTDQDLMLRMIDQSFSNILQASDYKACLTNAPAQEADELAKIYLEAPRRRASREKGARHKILQSMKNTFSKHGVWQLMWKDIPATKYSRAGDPLKIDCGYKADSTIKMFQATPLRTEITAAKVLAFSYPELAAGIQRIEGAQAQLTAIVEDGLEKNEQIEFARETLDRAGIQVAMISDLSDLAQQAAKEMGIR
jgi:hypothetical protein